MLYRRPTCAVIQSIFQFSVVSSLYSSIVAAAILPVLFARSKPVSAEETKCGSKRKGLCRLGEAISLLCASSWAAIGSMLRIVLTS